MVLSRKKEVESTHLFHLNDDLRYYIWWFYFFFLEFLFKKGVLYRHQGHLAHTKEKLRGRPFWKEFGTEFRKILSTKPIQTLET